MKRTDWFLVILLLWVSVSPADAEFAQPTYAPVNRLIVNTEAFLKENPSDHRGHYTLARIHYLALVNKANLVAVTGQGTPPEVAPDWLRGNFTYYVRRQHAWSLELKERGYSSRSDVPREKRPALWKAVRAKDKELHENGWQPERIGNEPLLEHASEAVSGFKRAIELSPKSGLYYLGLASLYRQYLQFTQQEGIQKHPPELMGLTLQKVREAYLKAYELSIKEDLKLRHIPITGLSSLVGYEAGRAYVELARQAPRLSEDEVRRVAEIEEILDRFDKLSWGAITPIVFSLQEQSSLSDLLDPDTHVSFDLDGDGAAEEWPWVKPSTGILVWDPNGTGRITSGRQLFGSATWWVLFPNGYSALNALDDNRDGWLTGPELDGIGAWFDGNSNGCSEPGEVLAVYDLGVLAINTSPSAEADGTLLSRHGMALSGGRTVATYDWIAAPSGTFAAVPLRMDE